MRGAPARHRGHCGAATWVRALTGRWSGLAWTWGLVSLQPRLGPAPCSPPEPLVMWACASPQVVHTHRPHFMALHCQEFGGKNYEASMAHVDKFVK